MDAKGPLGWACIAWEPRESIRSPARCVCARRGAGATKGAGARPSAAFSRGLGGAERSSAAQPGPLPAAAVRPMAQTCLLGRGRRSREDALGSAGGWNPAPGPYAPTARVLLTPEPEAALACQSWGAGERGLAPPSPLELQLTPLQLFPNAPGTGTCSPTLPPPKPHASRSEIWAGGWPEGRLAPGPRNQETRTHLQTGSLSRLWTSGSRCRYPSEFSLALNTSPLNKSLEKKQPLFPPHPTPLARFQLS